MAISVLTDTLTSNNDQVITDVGIATAMAATITGTFVGTITLQALYDTAEGWVSAPCFTRLGVTATAVLTAAGNRIVNVAGAVAVRALMTPYTSGTAEVTFAAVPGISAATFGGGGGGPVSIADGQDQAEGTTTDTKVTGDSAGTVSAKLRGLLYEVGDQADGGVITDVNGSLLGYLRGAIKHWVTFLSRLPPALISNRLDINIGASPATVPISAAALPLPATAATDRTTAAAPASVELSDGAAFYTAVKTGQLPAALISNRVDVNLGAAPATVTVQGGAAAGAAAAGNPVRVGGKDAAGNTQDASVLAVVQGGFAYAATQAIVTDAILHCTGQSGSTTSAIWAANNSSDNQNSGAIGQVSNGYGYAFNGTGWDRLRNNTTTNQFNGANSTGGATNHATQTNYNNRGVLLTLNITAVSGTTPTLDIKVQVADGAGTFFDATDSAGNAIAFAQKNATGTDALLVYPGCVEKLTTTGRHYNQPLPRSYRLVSTIGGTATPTFTYRLDVSEIG